jgi:hypothetical protein
MSWRNRKQDVYTNHGKVTTTTIRPATAPGFWLVTQFQQYIGSQADKTYEGVFPQGEADEAFMNLMNDAHVEVVTVPGNGSVLAGVIGEDDE